MTGATTQGGRTTLLDPPRDPAPVEVVESAGRDDVLLVCEHAGQAVPWRLDGLGLSELDRARHIGWDIGAEAVARALAGRLGCTLVVQRYSRLVIDCNRPPLGRQSIPEISDGTAVPGNAGLSEADKEARVREIFRPYDEACQARIAASGLRATYSIHSFEPALAGVTRPWDIGFCHRAPWSRGGALAAVFRAAHPDLATGENEPYRIEDETDWFIPRCAEPQGVAHSLIEIRNDLLPDPAACDLWADRLATVIVSFLGDPE